jgi:hypothetical protein
MNKILTSLSMFPSYVTYLQVRLREDQEKRMMAVLEVKLRNQLVDNYNNYINTDINEVYK